MNGRQYTPKLYASHVNTGTALPRESLRGTTHRARQLRTPKLRVESDDRLPATCFGGIGLLLALWRKLRISDEIDDSVQVLQRHKPYHESDHVLAHVANLFTGGTCIEDQASLQQDRAVQRMLGADRFPDPTTSGDFLRRFHEGANPGALDDLRAVVDRIQVRAWSTLAKEQKRRRKKLGTWGLVDMDSTLIELSGDQKEGADFSHKGKWSYHPLVVTLANTSEILAVRNRPGNSTSADGVDELLDEHLPRVATAFKKVLVRGDSAFDQASMRAACERHGAHFAVVGRRRKGWPDLAETIAEQDWEPWLPPARRRAEERRKSRAYRARRRGRNRRRKRALQRFYLTKSKKQQWVAETTCRPTLREQPCRLIIIRELETQEWRPNQEPLFELFRYRYILTNLPPEFSASDVVDQTYQRCDQENIIEQLGNELVMWRTPVREASGNAAWMELARLAWNLGKWLGLLALPLETIRWEWKRLRRAFIYVAAEVVLRARQTWIRFNPSHRFIPTLLKAHARLGP